MGFPGGSLVKNPPADADDRSLIPAFGKTPHASGHLHLCATATEPELEPASCNYGSPRPLQPMLCYERSHRSEKLVRN